MGLTAERRAALIARFEAGPRRLRDAWDAAPPGARRFRPAPGEWSPHEIVVHCADSETTSHWRIRSLLAQPTVPIQGYDEAEWAEQFDYLGHPAEVALALVEAVRANTVALLARLGDEAWEVVGTHSESGAYGAADWLQIYADHCHDHADQLDRAVEAWREHERVEPPGVIGAGH